MLQIRRYLLLAVSASLAACEADSPIAPVPVPQPLPALQSAVWHVNVSDGQSLPALLGHRTVTGGALEQDFLDSAQFIVNANGSWEHRGWYQRFRSGQHYSVIATFDGGTWTATTEAYEFRRSTGELIYLLPSGPSNGQWQLNLRYPNQAGLAVSVLRPSRPALSLAGRWRAAVMNDQPLPATYTSDPEIDAGAGLVSRHIRIDSAFVLLYANRSYRQLVFYSEWEGEVNGPPLRRVYGEVSTDFGSWSGDAAALMLESGYLQNKRIQGDAALGAAMPLRLNHGITHGDPPATLRYVRF